LAEKEIDKRTQLRTLLAMTTITATSARNQLYSLIDKANESHIPIQITGKRGNAVLVSEDDWRAISETIHLSTIPGMVDSIKKGMEEKIEECSDSIEW
jgi:prevent-host-death family protein